MNEKILNAMTDIDDEFLLEADEYKKSNKKQKKTWLTIAACIAILVILAIPLTKISLDKNLSKDEDALVGASFNAGEEIDGSVNNSLNIADKDMESSYSSSSTEVDQTVTIDNIVYRIIVARDDSLEGSPLVASAYEEDTNELVVSKIYDEEQYTFDDFLELLKDSVA